MLDYAKENAKAVEFIQADARDFNLGRKFQAITCLFDSINHLLNQDDVLLVFKNIYEHLEEHGIFVFDANSLSSSQDVDLSDFSAVESNAPKRYCAVIIIFYIFKKMVYRPAATAYIHFCSIDYSRCYILLGIFYSIKQIKA